MRQKLFGTNGIRGLSNVDMTVDFAVKMGKAIGTFFKGGRIAMGNDGRLSGPMLKMAVASGLCATGCHVIDIGLAPTPAVEFLVKHYRCAAGVAITASHNPPEFNGIKVCDEDGVELPRNKEESIEDVYFSEKFSLASWDKIGTISDSGDWLPDYIAMIKSHVDATVIKKRCFKVVVDPANSVGALVTPRLLKELGCEVHTINAHIDGLFQGRNPEPTPQNLGNLSEAVRAFKADLGVAHDGDADRTMFVDEKGEAIFGDKTLALIARKYLEKHPSATIVTPISSSMVVREIIDECGGRIVETQVGSIYISRKMLELQAGLGGEENGGILYGPHQPVRDGAMSAALILEVLASSAKALGQLIEELPKYYNLKDKVKCPNELKTKVHQLLTEKIVGPNVSKIDGFKINFPGRSWVLIRPSGTEPVYRIFVESKKEEELSRLGKEYKALVEDAIKEATTR